MAEEKNMNYEYLPEDYEAEVLRKKKAGKRKHKREKAPELNIDSLMDILTIILVFLLKSYATDPVNIESSADLQIPKSGALLKPAATVNITVSRTAISVDNMAIPGLELKDGKVDASQKRQGEDSYFITQLNKVLVDAVEKKRKLESINPDVKFDGTCTIIMDRELPYRLLTEVMYTAGQAEFSKFKFAVVAESGETM